MRLIKHPNVCRHLNIVDDGRRYAFIELEYANGSSLME